MSPLFYLAVFMIGGFSFCVDLLIEYIRLAYFSNGSDYVRNLLQAKKGGGWNDEGTEIKVT